MEPENGAEIFRIDLILAVALCLILLPGCYTAHVLSGGAGLLADREPIEKVLQDGDLTADERHKLELSQQIIDFAVSDLNLPDNGSYRSYVRLDRPYAVWNVVAAPALSIEPITWCFPIVGCVSYRGYFKEEKAVGFARKLKRKGNDVSVRGADAYSTLGHFKDPILSTFLRRRPADLALLLFHELAHQVVYVKDDTAFNESFATVVEREGVRRWLAATAREDEVAAFEHQVKIDEQFTSLLLGWREQLGDLYGSERSDEEKLREKSDLLERLRPEYEEAKLRWGGDSRYDAWFESPLNNARLAGVADYHSLVPPLERLLHEASGDLESFYQQVRELGELDPDERHRRLTGPEPATAD